MGSRVKDKLNAVQLQHWMRAVAAGKKPTVVNLIGNEIIEKNLPFAVADGDGLTFTLSVAGKASWVLRYRYGGRARELTIGSYPDIGLADVRKIARAKRSEIDLGGDPAAEKRKAKDEVFKDWTIRVLIEDYRRKVLDGLSLSSRRNYGRNLLRIESRLGAADVTTVTAKEIVALIKTVDLPWVESNMLLCTTKMLFKHAAGLQLVAFNPCAGIELSAIKGKRPPAKKRLMLTEEELNVLLRAELKKENLLAIKVLLSTAVRSEELINARWDHFDLNAEIWSIPSTKTGPGMQVPLTKPVVGFLNELKTLSGASDYVLPARTLGRKHRLGGDAPISKDTIRESIDYWLTEHKPMIRRFTPHDLRSTAKSHMRALGVPRDITEMCLNHKLSGIEGIYDVHTYFSERKAALERWSNYLGKLNSETPIGE